MSTPRLRVLLSAYACRPGSGSEPGVGWSYAQELSKAHNVVVLTRRTNRPYIEAALGREPNPNLSFIYVDAPGWLRFWKRNTAGLQIYYYLWQIAAYVAALRAHRAAPFDLAHHVTFGRYWMPSLVSRLPCPFVWGPVGGGESTPPPLRADYALSGRVSEIVRDVGRWLGERDPFVVGTARRTSLGFAASPETAHRLKSLGVAKVALQQTGVGRRTVELFSTIPAPPRDGPVRFFSMTRLIHWKGLHLALRAWAKAKPKGAEYWIIGDGPDRVRLERLAAELGVGESVLFLGKLRHDEALRMMERLHVLVHPALRDFSPMIVAEAQMAGRPVICLDLGGPSVQVGSDSGIKISAGNAEQVIDELAMCLTALAADPERIARMSQAARQRAARVFDNVQVLSGVAELYRDIVRDERVRSKEPDVVKVTG